MRDPPLYELPLLYELLRELLPLLYELLLPLLRELLLPLLYELLRELPDDELRLTDEVLRVLLGRLYDEPELLRELL